MYIYFIWFCHILGDEESPTVVLARIDTSPNAPEVVTVAEGVVTPDPFRDVIRTEPAPNLQSLIGDIMPFLARQSTTTPQTPVFTTTPTPNITTTITTEAEPKPEEDNYFSFDSVLKLLFPEEKASEKVINETTTELNSIEGVTTQTMSTEETTTAATKTTTSINIMMKLPEIKNSIDSSPSVGLLKLAGCNIYGRMYRVGRIISELSGPCLECMCTEVGVQCRSLSC